eukprot:Skav209069  [mRNA]  locus=scaffold760:400550:404063:+ [translate_table: standard]
MSRGPQEAMVAIDASRPCLRRFARPLLFKWRCAEYAAQYAAMWERTRQWICQAMRLSEREEFSKTSMRAKAVGGHLNFCRRISVELPEGEQSLYLAWVPWQTGTFKRTKAKRQQEASASSEGSLEELGLASWISFLEELGLDKCGLLGLKRSLLRGVMEGDAVTVEMSPFDLTRGRIVFRTIKMPGE